MWNKLCITRITSIVAVILAVQYPAWPQGTFVNLDFEEARVRQLREGAFGSFVPVTEGIPGWKAYANGLEISTILHNNLALDAASISIFGPHWTPSAILQGSYGVFLKPSSPSLPTQTTVGIGQTGQIPASAQTLEFFSRSAILELTFAGQPIPIYPVGAGPNYSIMAADISRYAGQTGELRFTGGGFLDNIQFSSTPVPEPGAWALFGLGGALLCCARWRRGK